MKCTRVIAVDVDGTLIPILVDFDALRERIRSELGLNHELKPLGLTLSKLPLPGEVKRRAWEIIEEAELNAVLLLDSEAVRENVEKVKELALNGFKIIIATNRSLRTLLPLIEKLGLTGYISESVTRDYSIDRIQQLVYLKEKYGELVFIGDTVYDEEASRKAGVSFIRVNSYKELAGVLGELEKLCR